LPQEKSALKNEIDDFFIQIEDAIPKNTESYMRNPAVIRSWREKTAELILQSAGKK